MEKSQVPILVFHLPSWRSKCKITCRTLPSTPPSTSGKFIVPQTFSFIYGQPFQITLCVGATTGLGIIPAGPSDGHVTNNSCAPGLGLPQTGNGTGTANFSWALSGITLTDSAGNPVNNATYTSASGTQYGPNGVIPEPRSLFLLSFGLIIFAVLYHEQTHKRTLRNAGRTDHNSILF
jgi:hypothetical protein